MSSVDEENLESAELGPVHSLSVDEPHRVKGMRRVLYLVLATLFLLLGLLGVLLPVLPTTPFLLVMSYFLVRSWPSLNERITQMPFIGRPLRNWRDKGGVEHRTKIIAYIMVSIVVIATMFSPTTSDYLKGLTLLLAGVGIYIVWRLPVV